MHLYVINQIGTDLFKIGHTKAPMRRLAELRTGNPSSIHMTACGRSEDAPRVENILHRIWHPNKVRGEWFKLNFMELLEVYALIDFFDIDKCDCSKACRGEIEKIILPELSAAARGNHG